MNEQIEITQKATLGSQTTQIGIQNFNTGLSPTNAVEMAFAIFREYYPQLREEALSEVRQLVLEKLQNVQKEDIVPPTPRIVVPVLQNASITEETEIRRLYANLLANSMNRTVKNRVFPGFVTIVNQLCSDEAKLLPIIYDKKSIPIITLRRQNEKEEGIDVVKNFSNIGEIAKCENPLDIGLYLNNLMRLGIIERPALSSLIDKTKYEPLKSHPFIVDKANNIKNYMDSYNQPKFKEGYMVLTDFGKEFCEKTVVNIVTIHIPPLEL